MNNKRKLNKLRKEAMFFLHARSNAIENIVIENIPDSLTKFGNSNDEWTSLDKLSEVTNLSTCLYKGKKGSIFPVHNHTDSSEQIVILNGEGKIRIVTPIDDVIVEYPNSYVIPKNIPHIVYFIEATDIICIWNPKFKKGWHATFNTDNKHISNETKSKKQL